MTERILTQLTKFTVKVIYVEAIFLFYEDTSNRNVKTAISLVQGQNIYDL